VDRITFVLIFGFKYFRNDFTLFIETIVFVL
jgi:hypothetical protein